MNDKKPKHEDEGSKEDPKNIFYPLLKYFAVGCSGFVVAVFLALGDLKYLKGQFDQFSENSNNVTSALLGEDGLVANNAVIKERMGNIETGLNTVETNIQQLGNRVTAVEGSLNTNLPKIVNSEFQQELGQRANQIAFLEAALERTQNVHRTLRQERGLLQELTATVTAATTSLEERFTTADRITVEEMPEYRKEIFDLSMNMRDLEQSVNRIVVQLREE